MVMKLIAQKNRFGNKNNVSANVVEGIVVLPGSTQTGTNASEAPLNNSELFIRDNFTCLYCGVRRTPRYLVRDYIEPLSLAGKNRWTNVVTACHSCNRKKSGQNLRVSGMTLLAVPYAPSQAETRIMAGRKIIADQMNFVGRSDSASNSSVQYKVQSRQRGKCYAEA